MQISDRASRNILTTIAVLSVLLISFLIFDGANKEAKWQDAEKRYADVTNRPTPTVTVVTPGPTVTAKPKPAPTVTVYARAEAQQRVSRSSPARKVTASASVTLACIRKHESGNNYRDVSSTGTYRGAYQMSRNLSPAWAKRAGYGEWASKPADRWPPSVQDAVAYNMSNNGRWWGHWKDHTSYHCPGF